jgi:hypothetical protein
MQSECGQSSSSHVSDVNVMPGRIRKRRYSTARIQPTRVKKVMQSDEEIGRMVASVPVAIGSAMEHFAERFLEAAAQCVQCSTSRTLSPMHMKYIITHTPFLAFLEPLVKDVQMPKFAPEQSLDLPPSPELLPPNFSQFYGHPLAAAPFPMPPMPHFPQLADLLANANPVLLQKTEPPPMMDVKPQEQPAKRKRGRPRKEPKDKFVNDGMLDDDLGENNAPSRPLLNGMTAKNIDDRILMPPPTSLPIRGVGRPRKSPVTSPNDAKILPNVPNGPNDAVRLGDAATVAGNSGAAFPLTAET